MPLPPFRTNGFRSTWRAREAESTDTELAKLRKYQTVIKLPLDSPDKKEKALTQLKWPPYALLTFRHVQRLEVHDVDNGSPILRLRVEREGESWLIEDSRVGEGHVRWRVARHCECPLNNVIEGLAQDEQKRIRNDGVSFLVAAPMKGDGVVLPTKDYLPVHVFYLTEQTGPVRLLLHAEFQVKSDRTALIPIDGSPFNQWVADRLACHVCEFVHGAASPQKPCGHVALLLPFEDIATHPVATTFWQRIVKEAREQLQLADVDGVHRLRVGEAKLLSVSVDAVRARRILEATEFRQRLLHHTVDDDKEARKALNELGCARIGDDDLLQAISNHALYKASDHEWLWTCWEWLAAWVAEKERYYTERR